MAAPRFSARIDKEEEPLLQSYMPQYEICQVSKKYKAFWPVVFTAYTGTFPLIERLWPGENRSIKDLTEDEATEYMEAVVAKQNSIKEWFRWRANPRSRSTTSCVSKKDIKRIYQPGRRRGHKAYEVFAKLYPDVFNPVYEEACRIQGVSGQARLAIYHKTAARLWREATQQQQKAVQGQMETEAAKHEEELERLESGEDTPEAYQRFQSALPGILTAAVDPAVRRAGMIAVCTIIGPVPEAGGQIMATTLQFGDSPETPLFSQVWSEHDKSFVEALGQFAVKYEFPEEVSVKRSLLRSEEGKGEEANTGQAESSRSGSAAVSGDAPPIAEKGKAIQAASGKGKGKGKGKQPSKVPATNPKENDIGNSNATSPAPAKEAIADPSPSNSSDHQPSAQPETIPSQKTPTPSAIVPNAGALAATGTQVLGASHSAPGAIPPATSFADLSAPGAPPSATPFPNPSAPGAPAADPAFTLPDFQASEHSLSSLLYHDSELQDPDADLDLDAEGELEGETWESLLDGVNFDPRNAAGSMDLDQWANLEIFKTISSSNAPHDVNIIPEHQPPLANPVPQRPNFLENSGTMPLLNPAPVLPTSKFPSLFLEERSSQTGSSNSNPVPGTSSSWFATGPTSQFSFGPFPPTGTSGVRAQAAQGKAQLLGPLSAGSTPTLPFGNAGPGGPANTPATLATGQRGFVFGTPANTANPAPVFGNPISAAKPPTSTTSAQNAPPSAAPSAAPPPVDLSTLPSSTSTPTTSSNTAAAPPTSPAISPPAPQAASSVPTTSNPAAAAAAPTPGAAPKPPRPKPRPVTARSSLGIPGLAAQLLSQDKPPLHPPASSANQLLCHDKSPAPPVALAIATITSGGPLSGSSTPAPGAAPPPHSESLPSNATPGAASLPGAVQAQQAPGVTSAQPSQIPAIAPTPTPLPPALGTHHTVSSLAKSPISTTSDSDAAKSPTPGVAGVDASAAEPPNPEVSRTRRSGRTAIKNTWLEKQNLIGTNTISNPTVPTTDSPNDGAPPAWFLAAVDYLKGGTLGQRWLSVLDKWASLEGRLGYGKTFKTPLPIHNRPEEWQKWTSKAKNGARAYDKVPVIDEPAEFGLALVKWWATLQPPFRVSDSGLLPIYSDPSFEGDPWVSIRKSGPNGFITIITLLDWWGRSAHSANIFKDDSREAWGSLVCDVGLCLDEMLKSVPTSEAKRGLEDSLEQGLNKRQKVVT